MKDNPLDAAMKELIDFLESDLNIIRESLLQTNGSVSENLRQRLRNKDKLMGSIQVDYELASPYLKERFKELILEHKVLYSLYL